MTLLEHIDLFIIGYHSFKETTFFHDLLQAPSDKQLQYLYTAKIGPLRSNPGTLIGTGLKSTRFFIWSSSKISTNVSLLFWKYAGNILEICQKSKHIILKGVTVQGKISHLNLSLYVLMNHDQVSALFSGAVLHE